MKNKLAKSTVFRLALALVCALLFFPHLAKAQDPHTLWFHSLGAQQGLSQNYNWYVYHDRQGFVWISSLSGLHRFDGLNVKVYGSIRSDSTSLLGEMIYSEFFEDSRQDIWFSTPEAIHAYRRKHDNFQHFFMFGEDGKKIQGDYQVHFLEQDSFLWVGTGEAIYRFNIRQSAKPAQKVIETKQFRCRMEKGEDGSVRRLYAFGSQDGLEVYEIKDGKQVVNAGGRKLQTLFFEDDFIREVLPPESDPRVWLMTKKRGLVSWQPMIKDKYHTWGDFAKTSGTLVPRGKDQLLLVIKSRGIFLLNKNTGSIQPIASKFISGNGSAIESFKGAYLDRDDNLWVSDENTGLHYTNLNKNKFRTLPKLPLAKNNTNYAYWDFEEDQQGNTWIGVSQGGVFVLDKNNQLIRHFVQRPGDPNSLPSGWVKDILLDKKNTIWVATAEGLVWFSQKENKFHLVTTAQGKGAILFAHLHLTKDGRILASTESEGVFEVKEVNGRKQLVNILDAAVGGFQTIFEDREGKLYIARNSTEICVYNFQNEHLQLLDSFPVGGLINGFYEDERSDTLYFATSNGLVAIDKNSPDPEPIIYAEDKGLMGKMIGSLLADPTQNLWLGTNKGLVQFDRAKERFRTFRLSDGIQSLDFHITAALKKNNGELWFGGSNGITIVPQNEPIGDIKTTPKAILTGLKINDEEIGPDILCEKTGATNVSQIQSLRLRYDQNTLSFEFIAIEYSDPSGNQLSYKLQGSDDNWVAIEKGKPGFARYSKLPYRSYTFLLKATNSDGKESEVQRVIRITIQPPWYLTWWAITLGVIAGLCGIYQFYRWRVAKIKREAELQQREAEFKQKEAEFRQREAEAKQQMAETETAILRLQMNPHFIFNSMNSINAYILKKDIDTASDYLGRFAKLMRMILDFAAKPYIPIADEIELLDLYIQAEAMRFENKFSHVFEVDESIDPDDTVIPTMILQPFAENAILHGFTNHKGRGEIRICFKREGELLICSVEDNGIGRAAASAQKPKNGSTVHVSKALTITKQRLDLLREETQVKTRCEIIDLKDETGRAQGTKVVLTLPLLE